jgi:hypothetical protein
LSIKQNNVRLFYRGKAQDQLIQQRKDSDFPEVNNLISGVAQQINSLLFIPGFELALYNLPVFIIGYVCVDDMIYLAFSLYIFCFGPVFGVLLYSTV